MNFTIKNLGERTIHSPLIEKGLTKDYAIFADKKRVLYDALVGPQLVLDRVLDGDHVLVIPVVRRVDHGGQGGALSASCRSGDEDEAARQVDEPLERRGQVQ